MISKLAIFIEEAEEHLGYDFATFLRTEDEKSQDYNALIRCDSYLAQLAVHRWRRLTRFLEPTLKLEHLFKTLLQDEIVSTSKKPLY